MDADRDANTSAPLPSDYPLPDASSKLASEGELAPPDKRNLARPPLPGWQFPLGFLRDTVVVVLLFPGKHSHSESQN
jgi:hypothetical protein|eukprot:COSAG06_NODE_6119_length_3101_cov_1.473351_4_plen_77_part_00